MNYIHKTEILDEFKKKSQFRFLYFQGYLHVRLFLTKTKIAGLKEPKHELPVHVTENLSFVGEKNSKNYGNSNHKTFADGQRLPQNGGSRHTRRG